jgi:RNA polymerase sigma-70 factor (ECF subfamily)
MDPAPLARRFREVAPDAAVPDERELRAWVDVGRAAWPAIELADGDFIAHVARHAAAGGAAPASLGDLYLARACAAGDPKAIAALETHCLADVGKAIWQVGDVDRDDVMQRVRETLLVGDEPLIASYAGRGSLRGWVRSIVVRTAIKQARATSRMVPLDEHGFLELAASSDDPALEPFKQRYRDEFRAAFRAAVEGLSVRHRNLLRHYFIDHMSIDELAALYHVHRATTARWIHDVRASLVDGVRAALDARLPGAEVGLRSVIDLVASQLELSLERWVGDAE